MSVFIQNDYCDAPKELMIQDFTENISTIKSFVNSNSPCGGGDSDECYELSLNRARSLNWQSPNRALVTAENVTKEARKYLAELRKKLKEDGHDIQ